MAAPAVPVALLQVPPAPAVLRVAAVNDSNSLGKARTGFAPSHPLCAVPVMFNPAAFLSPKGSRRIFSRSRNRFLFLINLASG